jgi:hypothetical protein
MNARAFSMVADGDAAWVTEDVPSLLGASGSTPAGKASITG